MTDSLSAELARIRERYEEIERGNTSTAPRTSLRLLAAVEAALKLADEAEPVDRDYGGEPIWWSLQPAEIREAILRELSGRKGSSDEA